MLTSETSKREAEFIRLTRAIDGARRRLEAARYGSASAYWIRKIETEIKDLIRLRETVAA